MKLLAYQSFFGCQMSSDYTTLANGLQILSTIPAGDGGIVLNDNFTLLDALIGNFNDYVNSNPTATMSLQSTTTNATATGTSNIFTVPAGSIAIIDRFSVMTISNPSPGSAPYVQFGTSATADLFVPSIQLPVQTPYSRYIVDNPTNGLIGGTIITATVSTASTATAPHIIQFIIEVYLFTAPA
jgi:hypothetical protein